MFETFAKRGKQSKMSASISTQQKDLTPSTMYSAVEFGGDRPDTSRRFTNNYGKTAGKRNDFKPEVGIRSSLTGRMFNAVKDGVSRYRGF